MRDTIRGRLVNFSVSRRLSVAQLIEELVPARIEIIVLAVESEQIRRFV